MLLERGGERLRFARVDVEQGQRLCTELGKSKSNRFARPSATRHRYSARRRGTEAAAERCNVTGVVGVEPDGRLSEKNRVAGADRRDGRMLGSDEAQNALLVRMRDIEAAQALRSRPRENTVEV